MASDVASLMTRITSGVPPRLALELGAPAGQGAPSLFPGIARRTAGPDPAERMAAGSAARVRRGMSPSAWIALVSFNVSLRS